MRQQFKFRYILGVLTILFAEAFAYIEQTVSDEVFWSVPFPAKIGLVVLLVILGLGACFSLIFGVTDWD